MKQFMQKFGKWAVVYVVVDNTVAAAILGWYFSPWWPL